jgi:hypothetical protein
MRVFAGDYSGICLGVAGRHGVARKPAPLCHPLFYWYFGSRADQDDPLRCVAAISRSTAFGCIQRQIPGLTGDSRAFGCKVGVATGERACHPLCLLGFCRLTSLCNCVDGIECAVFMSINLISNAPSVWGGAGIPINTGVARSLSPSCHPVPPCHPQRHALLDIGPELRVMTGPRERFLHGGPTEVEREGSSRRRAR